MKKPTKKTQLIKNVSTLAMAVSGLMFASSSTASDLEIYKNAQEGGGVVMMVLDNSGSMNPESSIAVDNPGILFKQRTDPMNAQRIINTKYETSQSIVVKKDDGTNGDTLTYQVFFFEGRNNTTRYFDRMSRLKQAIIPIFADPKNYLGDNYLNSHIGLAAFGRVNNGRIVSPVAKLTYENRLQLLRAIIGLNAETNTPIAHTYAEVAAYMLGTTTEGNRANLNSRSGIYLQRTNPSSTSASVASSISNGKYISPIKSDSQCMGYGIYFLTDGEPNGATTFGSVAGLQTVRQASNGTTATFGGGYGTLPVVPSSYVNGGRTYAEFTPAQQDGYWTTTQYLNQNALGTKPYDRTIFEVSRMANGRLVVPDRNTLLTPVKENAGVIPPFGMATTNNLFAISNGASYILRETVLRHTYAAEQGWEDVGYLAKQLRDPAKNPKGVSIETATVGFGADFSAAEGQTNCDAITTPHAKNLCLWGSKGSGFGEGSFTYAGGVDAGKAIADSLVKFITSKGSTEIQPISTGTMSVPLDAVNSQKSRGFTYLPALDPKPGSFNLWNGNLKKYYTYRGGVVDGSMTFSSNGTVATPGKPVFVANSTGEFSKNTYDIWNTLRQADNAEAQKGGTFLNVFENADIHPSSRLTRNLFINTGANLTSVSVNANTRRPVGFNTVQNSLTLADKNEPMNHVLQFLGYPAQTGTLNDQTAITGNFNKGLKKMGGVLHSLPQVVTHEVSLNDEGEFDTNSRKDSILYGSMEGALHFVDDKTGKEWFTFIPKELLELQSGALIGGQARGTTGSLNKVGTTNYEDNNYPHGVDAPWNIYNNYSLVKSGNTTQYKALQTFASGGLRMGGSTYYSLDVSDKTTPRYIYSVGSNYANYLQNTTNNIQGTKNGAVGTTDEHTAFARMGQSWGKPAIGFVKSGGKKVMVHFLPGGYDTCYEKPTFKLNDATNTDAKCRSKQTAQGNAVYMVQVAEEEINSVTKATNMKVNANSGKLLWWATNGTGTAGNTTRSTGLQASQHQDLTHSIVNEIRTVDRNYDGLTDHIYFADLGGQVWRADINNNASTDNATKTDNFKIDRVVKILDVSDQVSGTDTAPRFYERPLFTVTNEVDRAGGLSGVITVGTGNRSNPVSEKRTKPEAIYTVIDKDVGRRDLFCYDQDSTKCPTITLNTENVKVGTLEELKFQASDANIKTNMKKSKSENGYKDGWYFPLKTWATKDNAGATQIQNVDGLKMFNEPDAQARLLFVTAYNPNSTTAGNSCSAGVIGETQRTLMCLPFGNCANNVGGQFTDRSFSKAGIGIVDNILTQASPWETTDKGRLFGTLCTSGNCEKDKLELTNNPKLDIDKVGVDLTRVINPRDWWEK